MNNAWKFFSHESDITQLEYILSALYGINPHSVTMGSSLTSIQKAAHNLYCKIGASRPSKQDAADSCGTYGWPGVELLGPSGWTDLSYFTGCHSPQDVEKDTLDYLVLDALLHVSKELTGDATESLLQLYDKMVKTKELGTPDPSAPSRLLKDEVMGTVTGEILGISRHILPPRTLNIANEKRDREKIIYDIPVFMDKLAYLLIASIKKSPYRNTGRKLGFNTLRTLLSDYLDVVERVYDKEAEKVLAFYLIDRLFDPDTAIDIAQRLAWKRFDLSTDLLVRTFSELFFVQNPFCKPAYFSSMIFALQEEEHMETSLETWINESNAGTQRQTSKVYKEEAIRLRCGEYIRFLSRVYYPLLTAIFYYLFRFKYPDAKQAYEVLATHIKDQKLLKSYVEKAAARRNRLKYFDTKEKQRFVEIYRTLQGVICDKEAWNDWQDAMNVDYISARKYQDQIAMTVLKEKVLGSTFERK